MEPDLTPPQTRTSTIGRDEIEAKLRLSFDQGVLNHGWIISGPSGSGKATLAYRMARALLDPSALVDDCSFQVRPESRVFHLVAAGAHPDLFVAEREWDEKKSRYKTEISVDVIRKLTNFLSHTASFGGARVAIIDTADDLNRNAANALLKVLEEPPANTALFLLAEAPGRLLATIRSRCRRVDLAPVEDAIIEQFLRDNSIAVSEARTVSAFARGRPGFGLRLAESGAAGAIEMAREFIEAARAGASAEPTIKAMSAKSGDALWPIFCDALRDSLSDAARQGARENQRAAEQYLSAWENADTLIRRGDGLNVDRAQLLFALSLDLRAIFAGKAA